jgi:signal transduction histidine kinase
MSEIPRIRILAAGAVEGVVRRAATTFNGSAAVELVSADSLRRLEPAECLVVDAADHARIARATGFEGAIIVIAVPRSPDESAAFLMQGTHFALPSGGVDAIAGALSAAISVSADGSVKRVEPSVARTRRLLAAGELAVGLRHAFNNPLTALMAELQLLQMDVREPETRAAVDRMLELVRRLTELSRALESVSDRPSGM